MITQGRFGITLITMSEMQLLIVITIVINDETLLQMTEIVHNIIDIDFLFLLQIFIFRIYKIH